MSLKFRMLKRSALVLLCKQSYFRICSKNFVTKRMDGQMKIVSTTTHYPDLLELCQSFIPALSKDMYKGQNGRIGIIGGSKEYTGAPYFAGISSLKVGADLVHIFCTRDSSPVIKSYSPELIVHPILDSENVLDEMKPWIDRLHSVVLGPGLGRDVKVSHSLQDVIQYIKIKNLPLIIDADGLWLVTHDPSLVKGYQKAILTPNAVEFQRLYDSTLQKYGMSPEVVPGPTMDEEMRKTISLSLALGNVTVIRKGLSDIISNGREVVVNDLEGSPRRCGGQGDLLSGFIGTFAHWVYNLAPPKGTELQLAPSMTASYAASLLTRLCSLEAFQQNGRSTTASDLITQIHPVFAKVFEKY